MTHAIGTGTCNLSINLPRDERQELSLAAGRAGMGVGAFVRAVLLAGIEHRDQAAATRIRCIRKQYYGAMLLAVFAASLIAGKSLDMRRAPRRVTEERCET